MRRMRRQLGFAYIAAVVVLVILAALAITVVRLSNTQQATSTQDILSIRAGQAARAGIEWGLYRLRTGQCEPIRNLDDFRAETGFRVTVECAPSSFREGETSAGAEIGITLFRIQATACNGNQAACPDPGQVPAEEYVERRRVATVCLTTPGNGDCY